MKATHAQCSAQNCTREAVYVAAGLCRGHYDQKRSEKRLRGGTRHSEPDLSRFLRRVVPAEGDCWRWTGPMVKRYGVIYLQGHVRQYAHRWSYEHHVAPIPEGLTIDHLCRNTWCVNPWHMEPVPAEVNASRRYGTRDFCANGHALTSENVSVVNARNGYVARRCLACHADAARRYRQKSASAPTLDDDHDEIAVRVLDGRGSE